MRKKRKGVFAQARAVEKESDLPKHEKSAEEQSKLRAVMREKILTAKLSDEAVTNLINAMSARYYEAGDVLIKFGDMGDEYFVLGEGQCECAVLDEKSSEVVLKKTLKEGNCFGELALLYNSIRSATIKAQTACTAYVLGGSLFRSIIMASTVKLRNVRFHFLDGVKIFAQISRYEKLKLLDGLEVKRFEAGERIIREGDPGDYFYIVESGTVHVFKMKGEQEVPIRTLGAGDYFGEIALIKPNQKRTVTIRALEGTKLLALGRETFGKILGSIEKYLTKHYVH